MNSKQLRSQCAYVQQDDLFIASLSAKEHLKFQAMLRMGRNIPHAQKMLRVNEVISELSLKKCANTVIGSPGRIKGLSGIKAFDCKTFHKFHYNIVLILRR